MNGAFPTNADLLRVLPELVWCGFGVVLMLLQPFVKERGTLSILALAGAGLGGGFSLVSASYYGPGFNGLIQADSFSLFFHALVGTVAFLDIRAAVSYP